MEIPVCWELIYPYLNPSHAANLSRTSNDLRATFHSDAHAFNRWGVIFEEKTVAQIFAEDACVHCGKIGDVPLMLGDDDRIVCLPCVSDKKNNV